MAGKGVEGWRRGNNNITRSTQVLQMTCRGKVQVADQPASKWSHAIASSSVISMHLMFYSLVENDNKSSEKRKRVKRNDLFNIYIPSVLSCHFFFWYLVKLDSFPATFYFVCLFLIIVVNVLLKQALVLVVFLSLLLPPKITGQSE